MDEWQIERGVTCVVAPCCAFTFDKGHTDVPDGGYSCPACDALDLQERVKRVLDWVADCGCSCDAEVGTPLRDHDSLCPGYVEHMLTSHE